MISPPGLPSAQGLPGQDVGARPDSEGHGQRDPQAPLPDEGGSAVLHRPSDEAEQDEMRHVTLRPPDSRRAACAGSDGTEYSCTQRTGPQRSEVTDERSGETLRAASCRVSAGVQEYSIFLM